MLHVESTDEILHITELGLDLHHEQNRAAWMEGEDVDSTAITVVLKLGSTSTSHPSRRNISASEFCIAA